MAFLKLLRLAGHLLAGALTILLLFPHLDAAERGRRVTRWAVGMLAIFNIRVTTCGRPPMVRGGGAMLVSNHVSWLDIHILHSLLPVRFISKAEVQGWPLIGWLAQEVGTVFLVREKKSDAMRVNQVMSGHLRGGDLLALFPEGTTSDGREVMPFYPSLFQPAVQAGAEVWPVRLRYLDAEGRHSDVAAYFGDMSLGQSMWQIARQSRLFVEVEFLPMIPHEAGRGRRELAALAEAAIRGATGARGTAPGSDARLPA
ncbi:MAG: lysophospholipid acyltransferase family protein [Pseudomonadota bacterium]